MVISMACLNITPTNNVLSAQILTSGDTASRTMHKMITTIIKPVDVTSIIVVTLYKKVTVKSA